MLPDRLVERWARHGRVRPFFRKSRRYETRLVKLGQGWNVPRKLSIVFQSICGKRPSSTSGDISRILLPDALNSFTALVSCGMQRRTWSFVKAYSPVVVFRAMYCLTVSSWNRD